MKIIAVGRNYPEHIAELQNQTPETPVIFLKPDTAILKDNKPFYYPPFSNNIHYEVEVVIKIVKEGKNIQQKFAANYFEEIALGIDFTARDIQQTHKSKGLPWELAKSFDHSAPVSKFLPKSNFDDIGNLNFRLEINKELRQQGNTSAMMFSFDYLISYVSQYFTLKKGDLLFTGTPAGVGSISMGDHLEAYLENEKLLDFFVK